MNLNDFVYKTNSPELEAHFEQFGKGYYIDADEINSIVDTLKLMSNNVASSGFIEKNAHSFTGQNYIIAAFFKWAIDNSLYSNLAQVTLVVPYAASGKTRYERIAATTDNTFIRVIGAESSSAAVLPDLPTETLELTRYIVRDNAIDAPTPVEPTGVFVEKATYTPLTLNSVGEVGSLEMDKRAAIKAVGALTRLGNIIKNNSTHHFPGQLFVFIDDTPTGGVELPHLYTAGGSGSIAWFHPDGQDYVTQQKEVVLFVEDIIGSQKVNRRISSSLRNKSVTLEKMQDIPSGTFYARNSTGSGQPELLDVFDVLLMLDLQDVVYNLSLKQQKDKDFLITTNTPISELHNGCTLYVQNAVIITVPSTLPSDFKCCFKTKIGGQITWAITSPFTWYLGTPTIMYEKADALLTRELGTNNIYLTTT